MADERWNLVSLDERVSTLEQLRQRDRADLDKLSARVDAHEIVITRVDGIYTYVRNTWLVLKWGGSFSTIVASIVGLLWLLGVLG